MLGVEQSAERAIGPAWRTLPGNLVSDAPEEETLLASRQVPGIEVAALTAQQARATRQSFGDLAVMLRRHRESLAGIATAYGVPAPADFDQAADLCELAALSVAVPRPEASWLEARARGYARQAAQELDQALTELKAARARAQGLFRESVLTDPGLPGLAQQFAEDYRGLSKLSAAYRRDKRAVAGLTVSGTWTKVVTERLHEALQWRQAHERAQTAQRQYARHLGGFWAGEDTDFEAVRQGLDLAERCDALAGTGRNGKLLADQVAREGRPNTAAYESAMEIQRDLQNWRARLTPAPRAGGRPALALLTLAEAAEWYEAHLPPLEAAADVAQAVDGVSHHAPMSLGQARQAIELTRRARAEREAFQEHQETDRALLGPLHQAERTSPAAIEEALAWARAARTIATAGMSAEVAEALLESLPDPELTARWNAWRDAVTRLVALWGAGRRDTMRAAFTASFAETTDMIARLRADGNGPDEWRSFQRGRGVLAAGHLDDLIDRAAAQGVGGRQFVRLVERVVLQAWADHHLMTDPRLGTGMATQRDALVEEFRKLDKELIDAAYAQVIEVCNARRPNPQMGRAGIIRRESEKKSRHMPVRKLLASAVETVQLIKPCFMMSPLTVSQFLPPDFTFDVVIFDEASQVLPHDAINCACTGADH
ncbi:hypothetical protein GCM10022419_061070 [Nonomuraea rosea]|uniref:DNA2/NAM7 helicase helicase domain-containing protein n=1 Tax=Nonomuraea rosea TaxID=638574 RepID=A0ABP6XTG3_9ACTN